MLSALAATSPAANVKQRKCELELSYHAKMRIGFSKVSDVHRISLTCRESNAKYIWLGSTNSVSVRVFFGEGECFYPFCLAAGGTKGI